MYKVNLFVVAQNVIRDADTNSVSIIGVMEEMQSMQFPFVIPSLVVLCHLERASADNNNPPALINVTLNNGQLFPNGLPTQLQFGDNLRARNIMHLQGLVIREPGNLKFSLSVNNAQMAETVMTIHQVGQLPGIPIVPINQSH